MAELIQKLQSNPALTAAIVAVVYYFWPQIKTAFAGGVRAKEAGQQDEFLSTVDAARDLIKYLETAKDEEGAAAARKAASRLFESEAKPK